MQDDGTKIKQDAHSYLCGVALKIINPENAEKFAFVHLTRIYDRGTGVRVSGGDLCGLPQKHRPNRQVRRSPVINYPLSIIHYSLSLSAG